MIERAAAAAGPLSLSPRPPRMPAQGLLAATAALALLLAGCASGPGGRLGSDGAEASPPAGLDRAKGVISGAFMKDLGDPAWVNDAGVKSMTALMKKFKPQAALEFPTGVGLTAAALGHQVLLQCGREVTRDNIMAQTMKLDTVPPLLLPGLRVKTSPQERGVLTKVRLQEFDGAGWKLMSA